MNLLSSCSPTEPAVHRETCDRYRTPSIQDMYGLTRKRTVVLELPYTEEDDRSFEANVRGPVELLP